MDRHRGGREAFRCMTAGGAMSRVVPGARAVRGCGFRNSLAGREGVVAGDRDLPVRSEPGEEGEQGVGGPVAAGLDVEGPSTFERSFLDGQVAVEVNASGGRYVLVTEP